MFKIIAIILLAISTAGAGYFGWTQKKSVAAASAQVEELTQKVEEADKKAEATEEELEDGHPKGAFGLDVDDESDMDVDDEPPAQPVVQRPTLH